MQNDSPEEPRPIRGDDVDAQLFRPPGPRRRLPQGLALTFERTRAVSFKGAMGFVVLLTVVGGSVAYDLHNLSAMLTLLGCGLAVITLLSVLQHVHRRQPQLVLGHSTQGSPSSSRAASSPLVAFSGTAPHTLSTSARRMVTSRRGEAARRGASPLRRSVQQLRQPLTGSPVSTPPVLRRGGR